MVGGGEVGFCCVNRALHCARPFFRAPLSKKPWVVQTTGSLGSGDAFGARKEGRRSAVPAETRGGARYGYRSLSGVQKPRRDAPGHRNDQGEAACACAVGMPQWTSAPTYSRFRARQPVADYIQDTRTHTAMITCADEKQKPPMQLMQTMQLFRASQEPTHSSSTSACDSTACSG